MTYHQAMMQDTRRLCISGSALFPSGDMAEITSGDVISFTINEGDDLGLTEGSVLSGCLELILDNSSGAWSLGGAKRGSNGFAGAHVSLSLGVYVGSEILYRPLGTFICSDAYSYEGRSPITLKCQDALYASSFTAFSDTLVYPKTLFQVFTHALSQAGLVHSGDIPNGDLIIDAPPAWGHISVRKALSHCLTLMGAFLYINRSGGVEISPLASENTIEITKAQRLMRRDGIKRIEGVNRLTVTTVNNREDTTSIPETITVTSPSLIEGSSSMIDSCPLFITNGYNTRTNIASTLDKIKGIARNKGRFIYRGDPEITIGQKVLLTDGEAGFELIISKQRLAFDGGFYAECVCGARNSGGTFVY